MINFVKKNKWKIIISSLVTLLPIVAGLILWDKLPDMVPSHWGPTGEVDAYSSKEFFVFGLPLLMLGLNLLCTIAAGLDPKNKNHEGKPLILVYALIPALTILLSVATYFAAFELPIPVLNIVIAAFGLMIVVIGNYLPKCKPSYTIGIKISWTLNSEKNWVATHRMAGKLWVIAGALIILTALLPAKLIIWFFIPILLASVIVPFVYSYIYYKKYDCKESGDED
jgi:uncharacterized membrane protein